MKRQYPVSGNMGLSTKSGELWVYTCNLGLSCLRVRECNRHQLDPHSRGALTWDGCVSCVHRAPGNEDVAQADAEHAKMIAKKQWTTEWPKTPGHYWFYGWTNKWLIDRGPELYLIKLDRSRHGWRRFSIFHGGHMHYKDGARGLWKPAVLPEPPDEELTYDRA